MWLKTLFIGLLLSLIFISPAPLQAAPPTDFQTTQIIGSGLTNPTGFEIAPDGRIFVLQQNGVVRIYKNGQLLATPFTTVPVSPAGGDLGLLGIAFDPQFAANHYVYFYYTSTNGINSVARYNATNDTVSDGPFVLYESAVEAQQFHAGGTIQFGPDGKLYISIGENQYPPNSQELDNPAGKVLRINKDGTIPTDNPFYGQTGKAWEIWAYGLRNPFRFQFDKASGQLYLGDVGQDGWEEINIITKGGNYGWPVCEGTCSVAGMINPLYTYIHTGRNYSVTGGFVYNGTVFPQAYQGAYFFGDYAQGYLKTLSLSEAGELLGVNPFDLSAGSVVDMKEAPDGSMYYLTIFPGRLYQTVYATSNHVPIAKSAADVTSGDEPLTVHFSSVGSSDAENTPLTFDWNFGDGTSSTSPNPTKIFSNAGKYIVQLTVSDGVHQAQATPITIQAGTPPTLIIDEPLDGSSYRAGDTLSYDAHGHDSNGDPLTAGDFKFEAIFHHSSHTHPYLTREGNNNGTFDIPTTGETSSDVWYEIRFTATDKNGLTTTDSIDILPEKVDLTFTTNPPGLKVLVDSIPQTSPQTLESVVGFKHELNTPSIQSSGGTFYQFESWSVGGAQKHFFTTPSVNSNIVANFRVTPAFNANYYNNVNLTGTPALTRNEGVIDHDFGGGSPDPVINSDNFSARYTKTHYFVAGNYVFNTLSDDGVRLYIDGVLILDKWVDQPATPYSAAVALTEGNHDIQFEYYDHGGGAVVKLTWDVVLQQSITPTPGPTGTLPTGAPTPTPGGSGQAVTSFTLINADTDQVIATYNPLVDGATLNLTTLPSTHINVRANTTPATVGSVRFGYDINPNYQTENNAPYALASDNGGDYYILTPTLGSHTITATPFTSQNGFGTAGTALSITINVTNGGATATPTPTPLPTLGLSGQAVTSYTLINANTDVPIAGFNPIAEGAILNLSTLPTTHLNMRANTTPGTVGSVRFGLDAVGNYGTESYTPYALASDSDGDYYVWTPTLGAHTVVATPFTGQGATGTAGTALTLHFTVVDNAGPTPTLTPTPTQTNTPTPTTTPTSGPTATPTPTNAPTPTPPTGPTPTPTGQYVQSLTLINADTDLPISSYDPIEEGVKIKLSTLPTTRLTIRANTFPAVVGSLKFGYDANGNFQIENVAPYAFAGDEFGNYAAWTPTLGEHTVIATPYSLQNTSGTVGTGLTRKFTIEN